MKIKQWWTICHLEIWILNILLLKVINKFQSSWKFSWGKFRSNWLRRKKKNYLFSQTGHPSLPYPILSAVHLKVLNTLNTRGYLRLFLLVPLCAETCESILRILFSCCFLAFLTLPFGSIPIFTILFQTLLCLQKYIFI